MAEQQLDDMETWSITCLPDAHGRCLTPGDEVLPMRVVQLTTDGWGALVEVDGRQGEVDISLLETVRVGDVLLVHGGVALGMAERS